MIRRPPISNRTDTPLPDPTLFRSAGLSARAERSVRFDHVETQWTRRGPLLRLDGMRIGDGADAVPIGEAEVLVSQYAGLLPGSSFTELRLRGLELTLQRDDDGRWQVRDRKSTRLNSSH